MTATPQSILRSLRDSYDQANRQAAALVKANRRNGLMLIDLQGEIERAIIRAKEIAGRAESAAEKAMQS
jgi:hypothetical protein